MAEKKKILYIVEAMGGGVFPISLLESMYMKKVCVVSDNGIPI